MSWRRPVAVLAVLAGLLSACGGGGGSDGSDGEAGPPAADTPRFTVESRTETYVDTSRSPERSLVTTIFFPANAPGPFPLILFSHGGGTTGTSYSNLLSRIVETGYVVAAPNYLPTDEDPTNRPADARFVLTQVLAGPLKNLIDPSRVGAMGHSMGGGITLGFAFHSCCRDTRVRAAVLLASARPTYPAGDPFPAPAIPTLIVHGDADTRAPYASGRELYDQLRPPKFFVTIRGGDHTPPFSGEMQRPESRLVVESIVAFLDAHLKGQGDAAERLRGLATSQPTIASVDVAA